MTLKEASELLGYTPQTLSKYVNEGLLVNYGIGRKYRFKAEEVNAVKHQIKKIRK
jgi:excisionase family DNA binding protein